MLPRWLAPGERDALHAVRSLPDTHPQPLVDFANKASVPPTCCNWQPVRTSGSVPDAPVPASP